MKGSRICKLDQDKSANETDIEDRVDGLANSNSERTSINMHWDLEKKLIYS